MANPESAPKFLKVINYNLWHGLNGKGFFRFGELESASDKNRKEKRFLWQIEELKSLDADVIFLQECNPLYSKLKKLSPLLGMTAVGQLDQSGIHILGLGLPTNLATGLAILAKPHLELKKVKALKLSGGLGFCSRFMSFQLKEFRYALIAKINWQGNPILLINTHLHHGPVRSKQLESMVAGIFEKYPQYKDKFWKFVNDGQQRREAEVRKLLSYLQSQSLDSKILCGDLNVEPDHPLLQLFAESGFKDAFKDTNVLTWNKENNLENHKLTRNLHLPTPSFGINELSELMKDYDSRPRRIDYILTTQDFTTQDSHLVLNKEKNGLIGSDHFGLTTKGARDIFLSKPR